MATVEQRRGSSKNRFSWRSTLQCDPAQPRFRQKTFEERNKDREAEASFLVEAEEGVSCGGVIISFREFGELMVTYNGNTFQELSLFVKSGQNHSSGGRGRFAFSSH